MRNSLPKNKSVGGGQTLIGIIVAIAIFSILAQAILTVVGLSLNMVSFNRAKITARHLAQEKIELIRNLPDDNVGTLGGIPAGPIPQEENITRNKLNYTVITSIIYYDDPFDDVAPTDLLATDYKRVRIDVSWGGLASSRNSPIVLLTDIAPKGVETTEGGGTLSILVFDSDGDPIDQAHVEIIASSVTPSVNLNLNTGDNGRIILPGAPTCISCYEITVTKTGYSQEKTYSTLDVANPNEPHQTILEGQLTEISFAIDKVSTLNISTHNSREDNFSPLGNASFRLRGSKTIGIDTSSLPVYKYDEVLTSNSLGTISVDNLEWDIYEVILEGTNPYNLSGSNPLPPINIPPNTTLSSAFAFHGVTANNFLISFVDTSDTPIASVSATLSDGGSFTKSIFSGGTSDPDFGQVFFSNLDPQSYQLTATASGYLNFSDNFSISGINQEKVILNPQ